MKLNVYERRPDRRAALVNMRKVNQIVLNIFGSSCSFILIQVGATEQHYSFLIIKNEALRVVLGQDHVQIVAVVWLVQK
jgi:hypothetical protein